MLRLFALLPLVALTSCGGFPRSGCTEIGCSSGVSFSVGDALTQIAAGEEAQARACVDGQCEMTTLTRSAEGTLQTSNADFLYVSEEAVLRYSTLSQLSEGSHDVSLVIMRETEELVRLEREDVTFHAEYPNGKACGPACFTATVAP